MSGHWPDVFTAAGAGAAAAAAALWRLGWSPVRWARRLATDGGEDGGGGGLNGDVREIKETLNGVRATTERALDVALDTREDVGRLERKQDATAEMVFRLHEDDPGVTDPDALRDTLDVEGLPDDFKRGGGWEGGGEE